MDVRDHLPLEELQLLARAIRSKRVWIRYQAIVLAIRGRSAIDCGVRSVQEWVARCNGGPEALREPVRGADADGGGDVPPARPRRTDLPDGLL